MRSTLAQLRRAIPQRFIVRAVNCHDMGAAREQQLRRRHAAHAEADDQYVFVFQYEHVPFVNRYIVTSERAGACRTELRCNESRFTSYLILSVLSATTAHKMQRM